MRNLAIVLALACLTWSGPARAQAPQQPLRNMPVPVLDLERYSGTWHQVAHLPMFFQRKCVRDTTATYTPLPDGMIAVRNACTDEDGERIESTGVAEPVPGAPGSLRVRFAPDWMSWLPFSWAPYWVLAVDEDYRWAMVGGPDRKYLWILSREMPMDPQRYASLVEQARNLGYPVDELIREPAPATATDAPGIDGEIIASTNEPFWTAHVSGRVLALRGIDSQRSLAVSRSETVGGTRTLLATDATGKVELVVTVEACQDSMSGAGFPFGAVLAIDGGAPIHGCARPAAMPPPGEGR